VGPEWCRALETASAPGGRPALELLRESHRAALAEGGRQRTAALRSASCSALGPGGDQHAGTPTVSPHHAADESDFGARARASSIGLLEERTAHERRHAFGQDAYKVNSLTGLDRASAVEGEVVWDPVRSIWITGMFLAAMILGPLTFSRGARWRSSLLTAGSRSAPAISVGFHRRLIHPQLRFVQMARTHPHVGWEPPSASADRSGRSDCTTAATGRNGNRLPLVPASRKPLLLDGVLTNFELPAQAEAPARLPSPAPASATTAFTFSCSGPGWRHQIPIARRAHICWAGGPGRMGRVRPRHRLHGHRIGTSPTSPHARTAGIGRSTTRHPARTTCRSWRTDHGRKLALHTHHAFRAPRGMVFITGQSTSDGVSSSCSKFFGLAWNIKVPANLAAAMRRRRRVDRHDAGPLSGRRPPARRALSPDVCGRRSRRSHAHRAREEAALAGATRSKARASVDGTFLHAGAAGDCRHLDVPGQSEKFEQLDETHPRSIWPDKDHARAELGSVMVAVQLSPMVGIAMSGTLCAWMTASSTVQSCGPCVWASRRCTNA